MSQPLQPDQDLAKAEKKISKVIKPTSAFLEKRKIANIKDLQRLADKIQKFESQPNASHFAQS